MSTINERLGIGGETHKLKLGKSFQNYRLNRGPNLGESLHTIRYDFKPASVDTSKMADIDFGENNKVTVTMPNVESSGLPQTVFKGSRKPHLKECVLIIDKETGELTLERLTHNIAVKKTRVEGSSRAGLPRPITPSFETNQGEKNGSASSNGSISKDTSCSNGNTNTNNNYNSNSNGNQRKLSPPMINGSVNGGGGRPISPKNSASLTVTSNPYGLPLVGSPSSSSITSKSNRSSPPVSFGFHRSPLVPLVPSMSSSSSQPSMPLSSDLTSTTPVVKTDDDMIGILSESSSDSSDHGSSSSENSDSSSDEDDEIKQSVVEGMKSLKEENSSKAGSSSSSGSESSSDSEEEPNQPVPTSVPVINNSKPKQSISNGSSGLVLPSMPNMLSMPKFSQLSEDLQLSESGSDSD